MGVLRPNDARNRGAGEGTIHFVHFGCPLPFNHLPSFK